MSVFGFQQMLNMLRPSQATEDLNSVARATEDCFGQWTKSLYRMGDAVQGQMIDATASIFGAGPPPRSGGDYGRGPTYQPGGGYQPGGAPPGYQPGGAGQPGPEQAQRARAFQSDPRDEVIVRATRGTGQFSQDKKFIALRMNMYKLNGEEDGYHEGVWEANFKDPKELLRKPPKPEGPMDEPRGPVEHLPVAAYTKAHWVFGDGSSIIVAGPASSHLITLDDGSFIFMVSTAQIITGGTGRYEGAYGLVQSLGATHIPAGVNLFGPDPVTFEATTFDTFRVVRARDIASPSQQQQPQPRPSGQAPSPDYPFEPRYVNVHGSRMHYIEEGEGEPILFLHGNPTWSYLWRNVIPHLKPYGRCIAPDLIGMGRSDKPVIKYTFFDQAKYLEGFIKRLGLRNVTLVIHDWGSALGFHYAMEHEDNVRGIAFFEAMMRPYATWEDFPAPLRDTFRQFRTPGVGEYLLIEQNVFVEQLLPASVMRKLSEREMDSYREPFRRPADRKPIYNFANQLPIEGTPADVTRAVKSYSRKLQESELPKLLIYAQPGAITSVPDVEWARENLKNLRTVDIGPGL
jgi:haloalkane dehalogenase